ncbi:MAG: hypothetical protein EOO39_28315, partial [Cytophagaceae bacterium]
AEDAGVVDQHVKRTEAIDRSLHCGSCRSHVGRVAGLDQQPILRQFGSRPHWGKLFTMAPSQLQSRYEKLPAFKQIVQEYDPTGKFRNTYLSTNLYSV